MKELHRVAEEGFHGVFRIALILLLVIAGSGVQAQKQAEVGRSTHVYKDTLKLDFYSLPNAATDKRPLLVLLHGGGFSSGRRDGAEESEFCNKMALRGYAVASISYRLTRKGESFSCDCPAETKISTFVKAAEDLTDAVEYLISRQELPAFDRSRIVLVGSSAGAETILNAVFMTGHRDFKNIRKQNYSAVISFAGAMVNSTYINKNNALPVLFFHGKKDRLVPYGTEPHHYCPTQAEGYLMLDGPETIATRLNALGQSYFVAFDPEGGHEWAGKAYGEIDLIHRFIEKVVLQGGFEQTFMRLEKN